MQRARCGKGQGTSMLPPDAPFSPHLHGWPNQKLSEPHSLGIFMTASSCEHGRSLTLFSAPLPSLESRGGAEELQASNLGLVFPVTSSCPRAHKTPHEGKRHCY